MEKLLVIDYWSQYTHLITSRFRHLGVYTEIIPAQDDLKEKDLDKLKWEIKSGILKWIILSWGPNSVYDEDTLTLPKDFFDLDIPVLAICYWHQLTHFVNWWKVKWWDTQEYWESKLKIDRDSRLFSGINQEEIIVWMSHWDSVVDMAKDFKNIWRTLDCEFAASAHDKRNIFTLQFHPEVSHTQYWIKILENFSDICLVKKEWSMEKFLEFELDYLRKKIADKNIFLFISWWVDSTVAYFLLNRAIWAERIYPVFVDTGFMRKDESKRVESLLNKIW
jgi:GMP synthase (glutamine-hydrolysing)